MIWELCETIRTNERPKTYKSSGKMSARLAARAPVNNGDIIEMAKRRTNNTASGVNGTAINVTQPAESRSQATSTRRAGYRSATPESRIPLRA